MLTEDFYIPNIELPDGVKVLFTTRDGGVSDPPYSALNLSYRVGDDEEAVSENRLRLAQHLPQPPKWLCQSHGNRAVWAQDISQSDAEVADAVITDQIGVPCAIQTADCLPIILFSETGSYIAAVHAGWRGLVAGIIANTVHSLRAKTNAPLHGYIGPHISPTHFIIKRDAYQQLYRPQWATSFNAIRPDGDSGNNEARWQVDLCQIATHQLEQLGVTVTPTDAPCTHAHPTRFFSARRTQPTGRQSCLIYKT